MKKTRERISDPRKRDLMAPLKAPHPWGTKRPSLEQNFYEAMDRPENDVVDIKNNPVKEVTETGIVTADGQLREFDLIALATGFDAVTGGMKNMGLRDIHGVDLRDKWSDGTYSHIGMACADFPNMFFRKSPANLSEKDSMSLINRLPQSTEPKAQQRSATDRPASNARGTGSSTRSPSCAKRTSPTSTPRETQKRSGTAR